jgi:hypothetical protein
MKKSKKVSRLLQVLTKIVKTQKDWDNEMFHYEHCHCFSGFADAFALKSVNAHFIGVNGTTDGGEPRDYKITKGETTILRSSLTSQSPWESGREYLGLTYEQSYRLFDEKLKDVLELRTLVFQTIKEILEE